MAISIKTPFAQFFGLDGAPLEGGRVYFGLENQDPEQFPATVWWDENETIPVAQPVSTIGGYISRNGAPAIVFADGPVSMRARQADGALVFYAPSVFAGNVGVINISQVVGAFKNVDSIAELRQVSKLTETNVFVGGYYANNDGGGGPYILDPADNASADNGGTIIVAADGGRWKLQYTTRVSWKQFGAKMDGVTDDYQALQNGINALTGEFYGPPGNAKISAGLVWTKNGLNLVGSGETATTITATFNTGDIIAIGDGAANPNNCGVYRMSIGASVPRLSGAAIRFRNGHTLVADSIRLTTNHAVGFQLDGGAQMYIYAVRNFEINSCIQGIAVGSVGFLQEVFINDGVIDGATDTGILLLNVSGFYVNSVDCINCRYALTTFPAGGQQVQAGFFNQFLADTSDRNGMQIITNGGLVAQLVFTNSWASNNGQDNIGVSENNGVYMNPGAGIIDGVSFNSFQAVINQGAAIRFVGTRNVTITDPQIFNNSTSGAALRSGIEVEANTSDWSVIGGSIGQGGIFVGQPNNQNYGIDIFAGTSTVFAIHGVNLTGNTNGGIRNSASGTTISIKGNAAFANARQGQATVVVGASTVTVTHNLDVTPALQDIIVNPAENPTASSVASWWVDNITATTFRINTNTAVGAGDLTFNWFARTMGA